MFRRILLAFGLSTGRLTRVSFLSPFQRETRIADTQRELPEARQYYTAR